MACADFLTGWKAVQQSSAMSKKKWFHLYPAEAQRFPVSYQVGFIVGSTENQSIALLNATIESAVAIKGIECSYQSLNQAGVVKDFWERAARLATGKATVNSSQWKREKFLRSPQAIVIYTDDKTKLRGIRMTLSNQYGKSSDGKMIVLPDGSQGRFCPLRGPWIKNQQIQTNVYNRVTAHVRAKQECVTIETP